MCMFGFDEKQHWRLGLKSNLWRGDLTEFWMPQHHHHSLERMWRLDFSWLEVISMITISLAAFSSLIHFGRLTLLHVRIWTTYDLQCGRSSLSQRWGADLRAYCSVKFPMTLKMGLERSQLFPEIFEIVLRPFWWVAGSEQPSPPLRSPEAGELLSKIWDAACLYTKEFSNWTEQPPTLPGKLTPHLPMKFHQCFGSLNPDFWMRLFWQKWAKMYWDSIENFKFCKIFIILHQLAF